jgi:hypothetical protein
MRSRVGRAYTAAFIGALQEFPGVAPDRIAEVVRLRTLATLSQEACLTGRGSADEALKAANVAARAGRDLRLAMNAKPADVGGAQ